MNSSDNNNFKFFNAKPIAFLSVIYIYLIVVVIIIGLLYVNNLNDITTQTIPPRLIAQVVEKDIQLQEAKVIPAVDILSFLDPPPEIIEKGQKIFKESCASCHGTTGEGDGPAGGAMVPKPRNFNQNTGWKIGMKLSEIYKTLEEGIPGSGMTSYSYLLPEDKLALGVFIRSAFIPNAPEDTGDDLINLDIKYNLSEGTSLSAQIPIKFALKLIVSENNETVQKIDDIIASIKNMNETLGKKLFYKVTDNQFSALVTLNSDKNWKKNKQLFVDVIVNDAINNGFNGKVFQLSSAQWESLFNFLNGQIQ
ncbi:MAG: cytochrome c [Bacteroidetes bacterium]|nr:cytochrome c [Bacteroidota bacterium]